MRIWLILLVLLAGCTDNKSVPKVPGPPSETHAKYLPPNCEVVEDLGNGWKVVEFKVMGRKKQFLWRLHYSGNATTEVLTELR